MPKTNEHVRQAGKKVSDCWKILVKNRTNKEDKCNFNENFQLKKKILCTWDERLGVKQWYKSKNNWRELKSRNAGLQLVGIWTVHRSSDDSSGDVPMKSNDIQL